MLDEKKEYTAPRLDDRGPMVEGTLGARVYAMEGGVPPHLFDE